MAEFSDTKCPSCGSTKITCRAGYFGANPQCRCQECGHKWRGSLKQTFERESPLNRALSRKK